MPRGRPKGIKNKPKEVSPAAPPVGETAAPAQFKITLKSLGRVYKSAGETFEEAVGKIKISNGARAMSVITVENGEKKIEKLLNGRQTNGVFGQGSPSLRAIHLKGVRERLGV